MKEVNSKSNNSICTLIESKSGREYILRQLKRLFPLGSKPIDRSGQETFYNLGKFESYLELLLDLKEACPAGDTEFRKYISEILLAWFFDTEIEEEKEQPVILSVDPAGNGSDRTGVALHQGNECIPIPLEETEECCSECNWLNNEGKCDKKIESPDMYKCIAFENRDVIGTCESCKENIYDGEEYYHDTDGITWHKKCDCGREDE